jgi:photoactive yellow protein
MDLLMTSSYLVAPEPPSVDFATLDLLPYGIIVLDATGTILYYNAREEAIAGRSRDAVMGRNFFRDVAPCTQLGEFFDRFRDVIEAEGLTAEFGFHFPFPKQTRDVEIALTSFRYGGEVLCLVSVRDLSEEEDLRQRIRSAERFSEIGEVTAGVAHNFNNVLMAISTWTSVLSQQEVQSEMGRRAVQQINAAVDGGRRMIERIQEGIRDKRNVDALVSKVNIESVIRAAVDMASPRAGTRDIRIVTDFTDGLPALSGDEAELQEVVVNLIANAIDAIGDEGVIEIGTRSAFGGVAVDVTDNGSGMPEATRRKLFRPLFTTKGAAGTGLGLSTSFAIILRHGGEMHVRSSPGEGSTFTFRLPAS